MRSFPRTPDRRLAGHNFRVFIMRYNHVQKPRATTGAGSLEVARRRLAQLAIVACVLSSSTGLAANPLRAEEGSPPVTESALAAPPILEPTATTAREEDLKQPPSHPTRVEIDVEVVEISQIQDHDQKFDVEFNAYFIWNDPRLAFDAREAGVAKKIIPSGDLWIPDPLLVDELEVDERGGTTAHVQPDGTVYLNRYYRGSITGSFDLHEFPLDHHDLEVALEATDYETDEVVFAVGEVRAVNPAHVVPHGWKLLGMSATTGESKIRRTNETFSLLRMTMQVTRDPHFYFWSIVLPLIPIMATAWSVFWMDPKEFSSQVGVGITAMLTVVAYRITIDSSLPPLTYMTRMDYFLLVCQTFVFLAFVSSVSIHVLYALDVPHMRALRGQADRAIALATPRGAGHGQHIAGRAAGSFRHVRHLGARRARRDLAAWPAAAFATHAEDSGAARVASRDTRDACGRNAQPARTFPRPGPRSRKTRQRSPQRLAPAKSLSPLRKVKPIPSRPVRVQLTMGVAARLVAIEGGRNSGSGFHVTIRAFLGHVLLRISASHCSRTSG